MKGGVKPVRPGWVDRTRARDGPVILSRPSPRLVIAASLNAGVALRLSALGYETPDVALYLRPWYLHAAEHGWAALGSGFTNYAPFYSYLLLAVAQLDGLAAPLTLVKLISFPFELGSAILGARLVGTVLDRPDRAALAFAALWLAPSVLHNGAFWGQADSIWTFFLLLSLLSFCQARPGLGALAFAIACSV